MAVQKAIVIQAPGVATVVNDRPIPTLSDDSILVKNVSVGLNPTDWKHIDGYNAVGTTVGCDFAGVIEAVGKDVKKSWKKGDRVCGMGHGSNALNPETGVFAEYIVVKGDLQLRIPDSLSFQDAASLGVGINTVGQIASNLKLSSPADPVKGTPHILVYGGSTATGTLAIQYAKLSGYNVIATCSPHSFDLVLGLGADIVYDYKDPKSAAEVHKYSDDKLKLAVDCIGSQASGKFCEEVISTSGGDYCTLVRVKLERPDINYHWVLAYTCFGEPVKMGEIAIPALPEHKANAEKFAVLAEGLLAEEKLKTHPSRVGKGGLNGVLDGLDLMRNGKVSGEKLVYNVEETS
ncbi:Protein TOXD [Penicillium angulare]|uniref:Protein TOXD n=1 Tax=Penicillium angulare TaxID=116970 RepID=UPI002540DC4A|nr:Protein TOXD [Penicillium angulare]KAJ5280553.1 Protein TOXD [Penicillium angulare]